MTPEERQILIQTHRMVEENSKLLRKMHRAALFGRIFHIMYWVIIIGLSVGAYYFVQPYVDKAKESFEGIQANVNNIKGAAGQVGEISTMLKQFGN